VRVLLLNQFYRPDVAATGQLLADLGEGLATREHEVHVLCSRGSYGGGDGKFAAEQVLNGVRVHRVGATGFGRARSLGRIVDYLSFYLLALWRALSLPRMDVCVALTTPPFIGLVGLVLRVLKGTRLVLWTMDLYPEVPVAFGVLKRDGLVYRLLAWLSRRIYGNASRIISLGEVMSGRLIEAGANPNRITTVHNWSPGEVVQPGGPR